MRKAIYFDLAFVAAIYRAAMLHECFEGMDDFFLHSPRRTSAQPESRVSSFKFNTDCQLFWSFFMTGIQRGPSDVVDS